MAENQKSEWEEREVGALWKKQSRAGQKYLSGKVKVGGEEVSVVCFTNDNKKTPITPTSDFIFLEIERSLPKPKHRQKTPSPLATSFNSC